MRLLLYFANMLISTNKLNKSMPISLFFVSEFNDIYIKCFKTSGTFSPKNHFGPFSTVFFFAPKKCLCSSHTYAYISETVHLSLFINIDDRYKVMYCLQFGIFILTLNEVKSRSPYIRRGARIATFPLYRL